MPKRSRSVLPLFVAEGCASWSANQLGLGVYFYTSHEFGWGMQENFVFAIVQSAVYIAASLLASKIAAWLGRRAMLVALYIGCAITVAAMLALTMTGHASALVIAGLIIFFNMLMALGWPAVESLASSGVSAKELSKRISYYNLVWSGIGAIAVGVNGLLIENFPRTMFLIPAILCSVAAAAVAMSGRASVHGESLVDDSPHAKPEKELAQVRTLALWLSRILLPATYVTINALMAMMPSLPVMKAMDPTWQTIIGSTWMVTRWVTFAALGLTAWWHTRPRLLLVAAAGAMAAFLGVALGGNVATMISCQFVLGVSLGIVYAASLYFGMVLSSGSTEHGGYHEALIGLGSLMGPGIGAISQWIRPNDFRVSAYSVASVIFVSLMCAVAAERVATARRQRES